MTKVLNIKEVDHSLSTKVYKNGYEIRMNNGEYCLSDIRPNDNFEIYRAFKKDDLSNVDNEADVWGDEDDFNDAMRVFGSN